MQTTLCILGRQPAIGRAELESVFGADCIRQVGQDIVELSVEPKTFTLNGFGGTQKAAQLLTYIDSTNWRELVSYVTKALPEHLELMPAGKLRLGLSAYGLAVTVRDINTAGLIIKKVATKNGRSTRVVPNKSLELNTAQVIHNQMTGPTGLELLFIRDGERTILAQTIAVQDITAYTRRDQERPNRDARVGMLPPKLAQIIINLAVGDKTNGTVLDPFCGTGVVLQEALLKGFSALGSDLDPRMVQFSQDNLAWLKSRSPEITNYSVEKGDASRTTWEKPFDAIAAETYLGKPLTNFATHSDLTTVLKPVDQLHRATLENIAKQTPEGFRLCLAVPAWRKRNGFTHLPCLDDLEKLGYTRLKFTHASAEELIYFREDQFVARELVTLIRK